VPVLRSCRPGPRLQAERHPNFAQADGSQQALEALAVVIGPRQLEVAVDDCDPAGREAMARPLNAHWRCGALDVLEHLARVLWRTYGKARRPRWLAVTLTWASLCRRSTSPDWPEPLRRAAGPPRTRTRLAPRACAPAWVRGAGGTGPGRPDSQGPSPTTAENPRGSGTFT
jgi:hypothetical protein